MSDPSNASAAKKKSKKRKKKTKTQQQGEALEINNGQPAHKAQQSTDKRDHFVSTSKCYRCKGIFRHGVAAVIPKHANWMCPSCDPTEESTSTQLAITNSAAAAAAGGCNCAACVAKRENSVTPEVEKEAHITQTQWMEIRQIVRCIYRDNMMLSSQSNRASIGSDKMRLIVNKLCSRDPHQFFQRLETLAREYLLEVKVRLLEQLSCGFNSPQLAIEFIQMLLDEYGALCNALPALLYLLEPLEACEYVQKLGMTIELMNKNIFRELIFAESFMSSNLPLIIAQLRLASLASDTCHRSTADELSQRYVALDREMQEVCLIWRAAKDQISCYQDQQRKKLERKKAHFEKIIADGESFKQLKRQTQCAVAADGGDKENAQPGSNEVEALKTTPTTDTPTMPASIHSVLTSVAEGGSVKSKQALEWSRLLFKCIKPVGEPEFRLNGDIATHTITLHLDMTELDLTSSKPVCTRGDLLRYRRLGLSVEEVVEVTMKLNTLRALGINLKIEDLFDNEGFSLSDINDTLVGTETLEASDKIYFIDDEMEASRSQERAARNGGEESSEPVLSAEEEVDLHRTWELIVHRQECNNGRSRQHDFLQGMTMKIRFMKRLTVQDLDKNFLADGGRVIFNACDQVQMKLTQLELNSVRVVADVNCVGDELGLQSEVNGGPAMNTLSSGDKSVEDLMFVHTDSHKEFMDLLLEKRKQLESLVSSKQRERNAQEEVAKEERNAKEEVAKEEEKTLETDDSALRYEVREQQESSLPPVQQESLLPPVQQESSLPPVKTVEKPVPEFKPVYLANSSQPCQCSACVGAMAATIRPVYTRPLNPTDPNATSLSSLTAHLDSIKLLDTDEDDKTKSDKGPKKRPPHPMTKEGLWQNWMSTSGSAQIESEVQQIQNGSSHHHHHHHHHHHAHYNCCHGDGAEGDSGYGDSIKSCDCRHEHQPPNSTTPTGPSPHPLTCSATHNHTGSPVTATTTACQASAPSHGTGGTDAAGNSESSRRYCPCCYCELFGHNGPPTAPTSHNFTKQRDKMRAKLEDKRKKRDPGSSKGRKGGSDSVSNETSVEELLAFIEGDEDNEPHTSSRAAKRQRRKLKKLATSKTEEPPQGNGGPQSQEQNLTTDQESETLAQTDGEDTAAEGLVENGKCEDMKLSLSSTDSDLSGSDNDDYDDELEEFKKFCFAPAPVENRKKIAISLNMNSFMSKLK